MKIRSIRLSLTIIAFVLASTAALAFTPPNVETYTILVRGREAYCPVGYVSDACRSYNWGSVCTFQVIFNIYMAIDEDEPHCEAGQVLRYPQF